MISTWLPSGGEVREGAKQPVAEPILTRAYVMFSRVRSHSVRFAKYIMRVYIIKHLRRCSPGTWSHGLGLRSRVIDTNGFRNAWQIPGPPPLLPPPIAFIPPPVEGVRGSWWRLRLCTTIKVATCKARKTPHARRFKIRTEFVFCVRASVCAWHSSRQVHQILYVCGRWVSGQNTTTVVAVHVRVYLSPSWLMMRTADTQTRVCPFRSPTLSRPL